MNHLTVQIARPTHGRPPAAHRAFTLIEMVVSLSIISIVFLAMGSVMLVATKAIPSSTDASVLTADTADLVQQMVSELQTAKTVTVATDTGIVFTVPDRDNDGSDETIVYLWGGVAGSQLVRQYNGGTLTQTLPSVYEFSLNYSTKSVAQPDISTQSAEVELASHAVATESAGCKISSTKWAGQYFTPTGLPVDATGWNVTRVLVKAKKFGPTVGETLVQLRPAAAGGIPKSTVLEEVTMVESDLGSEFAWQEFNYSAVQNQSPTEGLCITLQCVKAAQASSIEGDVNGGTGLLETIDGGTSWTVDSRKSLLYYVYGTYNTSTAQPPADVLRVVTITLNTGTDPASRTRTTATALNQPQMP